MQFLLCLAAIAIVIYGVVTASLLWVIMGALGVSMLFSGRLGSVSAEDAKRIEQLARTALGPLWQQLLLVALLCTGIAGWISHQDLFARSSIYFWLAALVLVLAAGFVHDRPRLTRAAIPVPTLTSTKALEWILAGSLTLVALGLRLYQIGELLPPVHGDEGEMGLLALLARHGAASGLSARPLPFFDTAFLDHPTLFHYVQAFAMFLFGETIRGLRILSAIMGALCVPLVYAIGRLGWGKVAGVTAGWLIAVSHLHIHYSRIALNNIETVLFVILLIWLLALVYASNQPRRADLETHEARAQSPPSLLLPIAVGLVIGLGQYFYYGSRLLPVLALPLLFYLWHLRRITLQQIAVLMAAMIVAYFPLALLYISDLPAFVNRLRGVSVFNPEGLAHTLGTGASWPNDIPLLLWTQIKVNLSFFLYNGDKSSFYLADIPAFDKVTVTLFWLGLGIVLAKVRRYHELALVTWFGLGVFFAGVVTTDAPHGPRLIVAVPAVYLISGVFVQKVYDLLAKVWPANHQRIALMVVGAIAATTLYLNFNSYFVFYKRYQPNLAQVSIAREMADAAQGYRSYLLGAPNLYANYGTIRLIAIKADKVDLEGADSLPALLAEQPDDKGALIIALPHRIADLEQIEEQFPHGTKAEHRNALGELLYVTYRIPAESIQ